MNNASLEALLNELLALTLSLEKAVQDEEEEPDTWLELLDERQEIMDELSELFAQGITLTEDQKRLYIQPLFDLDQKIVPMMGRRKQGVEVQMANLQKSKQVNMQYGGYGSSYSPYGAFFDKKK